ncbi:MAG: class II histone deacetylase [Hyphomicrobiaceae bacterium]
MPVFFHESMLDFRIPDGVFDGLPSELLDIQMAQPERPERLANTVSILKRGPVASHLDWCEARPATDTEILTFHTPEYLQTLEEANVAGRYLTQSTHVPKGGLDAIRRAAGAAIDAARVVVSGEHKLAYALVRPPAHHAQPDTADGYCFVNNCALAALEALGSGAQRVALVDWDVHHGNGAQAGFYHRNDILTVSIHMNHGAWGPTHVQTGDVDEIGEGVGTGFNLNLPLPFGTGDHGYAQVFERCVAPALRRFNPDLIVLVNGQDANQFDPNGRQCVTMAGFHHLADNLRMLANELCNGKVAVTQEGGYNPTYAPYCAYAVAAGLLGLPLEIEDPIAFYPDDPMQAKIHIDQLMERHPLLQ